MSIGPPAGEPSNFHRIRETTTVNARNAADPGAEMKLVAQARSQKSGEIPSGSLNFSAIPCQRGPATGLRFFNNACVHATDILYISFRSVNRDINIFAEPRDDDLGN